MRAIASLCMAYAAIAAAFAGGARRSSRARRPRFHALAFAAAAACIALWPRGEGAIMTGLCVAFSLSMMATLFVLVEPLLTKLAWRAALAAPVIAIVAALLSLVE